MSIRAREHKREGKTNLIKRTCVLEAALPHLIDSLFCRRFIGACSVCLYREHSSPPNAILQNTVTLADFFSNARIEKTDLMLPRKRVLAPSQFPCPSTIATQARSADQSFVRGHHISEVRWTPSRHQGGVYLATCMVSNVVPINVKLRVIVHMYQLVNEGVFHVLFIDKSILTEKDPVLRTEAPRE